MKAFVNILGKPRIYLLIVLAASLISGCVAQTNTEDKAADGLDTSLFFDGAIEELVVVDCTLTDGTETSCYEITISGNPANHDIGPFCPPTIASTAEEGGIWFDGNTVYDLDGEFVVSLPETYNDENWQLYDEEGNVNITKTQEEFEQAARPNVDPSLQNHCVEGRIE